MKRKTLIIILIVIIVIIIIWVSIVRKKKQEAIDQIYKALENPMGVAGDYRDLSSSNAFNPSFYEKFTFTDQEKTKATQLAKQIYDALGYFQGDDEESVYSAFEAAGSKAMVSLIAYTFQQEYGKSLLNHLSHLDEEELNQVNSIVNNLPDR